MKIGLGTIAPISAASSAIVSSIQLPIQFSFMGLNMLIEPKISITEEEEDFVQQNYHNIGVNLFLANTIKNNMTIYYGIQLTKITRKTEYTFNTYDQYVASAEAQDIYTRSQSYFNEEEGTGYGVAAGIAAALTTNLSLAIESSAVQIKLDSENESSNTATHKVASTNTRVVLRYML